MRHPHPDWLRASLFTALGLCPNACVEYPKEVGTTISVANDSGVAPSGRVETVPPKPQVTATPSTVLPNPFQLNGRAQSETCAYFPQELTPRSNPNGYSCFEDADCTDYSCLKDADCTEKAYGICQVYAGPGYYGASCVYGCSQDSECATDQACLCNSSAGRCVSANCRTDADCGTGQKCAAWYDSDGCNTLTALACTTSQDECGSSADCQEGAVCKLSDTGIRICDSGPRAVCGRPFLVRGSERLAALSVSSEWPEAYCVETAALSADSRNALGQRWAELGLMEHASIAAFARFALQLLHVGAPIELLLASQQAMLDETQHAQACFGLASSYLAKRVGPGALPTDHALDDLSLESIVRLTIREGCVGETIASLEAATALDSCRDPATRGVLTQIRADEARHAELAWRFVQWALQTGGEAMHAVVAEAFELAISETQVEDADSIDFGHLNPLPYGVVPASVRNVLRRSALRDVVVPCAHQLLRSQDPQPAQTPAVKPYAGSALA